MSMIVIWSKRVLLVAAAAALSLGSLPVATAFALSPSGVITPTPPAQQPTSRLVRIWSREQAIYAKLGTFFNNSDQFTSKAQELINKAKANGKDTSAVQAALDAFDAAVKQAQPIYQSISGIVSSHQGFDANGNVIDQTQGLTTVKDLGSKLMQIHQLLAGPRKSLREAVKTFREANMPTATPTSSQSSG